jgi:hypothetical protein
MAYSNSGGAMTYDYSLGFLQRNADMVAKLIQVATTGETLAVDFDDWAKLRYYQQQVHSLLANISKNVEDYADIRKKVRCWTEHREGNIMRLNIGIPSHRVTGRPPGMAKQTVVGMVPAEQAAGMYEFPKRVEGADDFNRFIGMVTQAGPNIRYASARFDSLPDDPVFFFNDLLNSWGWKVQAIDGLTLKLERL